ncbi:MAG: FecR domain-containing protein [Cyanobacteria bacterium P01_D01_bin.1]
MQDNRLTSNSGLKRTRSKLSLALSLGLGITSVLLTPFAAAAEPAELEWARVDFLSNRVQLVPREQRSRRARIADVLSIGDALRTARASRAELRFNDGSLARIGERATFRFTPNTRNFQLSNGTVLLLIPPGRGRSTIQTPNAVTGIQGSALFVRYIPETDTTIVGALTDNPKGPMVLFNEAGTERQALRSNEIGVITGDRITEIYQFDGALFWQSSGLAEGFDYLSPPSPTGDPLDGVREEIREALSNQRPINGDGVIENPDSFSRPAPPTAPVEEAPKPILGTPVASTSAEDSQASNQPGGQSDVQASTQSGTQATAPVDSASPEPVSSSIAAEVAADASDPSQSGEVVSETGSVDQPGSDIDLSETPAASESPDLEAALDLELELELEADGVEAPELDINETVQQYLEGGIVDADLNNSPELGVENSLQSIDADDAEDQSVPTVSSSTSSTAEELTGDLDTPDDSFVEGATDNGVAIDSGLDSELNNSGLNSSAQNDNGSPNGTINSSINSDSDSGLPSTGSEVGSEVPSADGSLPPEQPILDPSTDLEPVVNSQPSVGQDAVDELVTGTQPESGLSVSTESTPTEVTADPIPPVTSTTSSAMTAPPATPAETLPAEGVPAEVAPTEVLPTEIVDEVTGDVAADSSSVVNVVDILPAADEPPVQVFIPADKVDDFVPMHSMEDRMNSEDHMADDMMDDDMMDAGDAVDTGDSMNPNVILGDAISNSPME